MTCFSAALMVSSDEQKMYNLSVTSFMVSTNYNLFKNSVLILSSRKCFSAFLLNLECFRMFCIESFRILQLNSRLDGWVRSAGPAWLG